LLIAIEFRDGKFKCDNNGSKSYFVDSFPCLTNQTSKCISVGCGDVNCDSSINMGDVIALLYYVGYGSEICSEWALDPKPIHGMGDCAPEEGISVIAPSEENILNLKVEPHVFWLNFYGPELVKKFGKEKLLSMPAYRVEELEDGILFLESPLPPFYIRNYRGETCKKIRDHFGWKVYDLDVFDPERLVVKERGDYEKKFGSIDDLKKFLEEDIAKFRNKGYKIFAILDLPEKPIPEHVKEMESWLKERGVDVRIIRW